MANTSNNTKTGNTNKLLSIQSSTTSVKLSLPYKSQNGNYLCWAACVASVGQYKKTTSKTCFEVADAMNKSYTASGTVDEMKEALSSIYSYNTTATASGLSSSSVVSKIDNNKPVIAGMEACNSNAAHAVVIAGYNYSSSGMVYSIRDPYYTYYTIANPLISYDSSNNPIYSFYYALAGVYFLWVNSCY